MLIDAIMEALILRGLTLAQTAAEFEMTESEIKAIYYANL